MNKIKTGDLVYLKSRGPMVTVRGIRDTTELVTGDIIVRCGWFDQQGNYNEADFYPDMLVSAQ